MSRFTSFIHQNCLGLFLSAHFLFWEILNWIWLLQFVLNVTNNLSKISSLMTHWGLILLSYPTQKYTIRHTLVDELLSLRKQPTFRDATSGFPAKRRLRNEHRNSILMTIGWSKFSLTAQPIRSTTQIWVVTRHQYGISARISSRASFRGETSGVAKCRLFSQANELLHFPTLHLLTVHFFDKNQNTCLNVLYPTQYYYTPYFG